MRQILEMMKKLLPLLLFVLLAFAGCQREPATYQMATNPREFVPNVEKFVKQVSKNAKHYKAEDWQVEVEQFVAMSKNYVEYSTALTEEEIMRYNNARLQFMAALDASGDENLVSEVKGIYSNIVQ